MENIDTLSHNDITVRLARHDEGPTIGSMVQAFGGPAWDWLDWSDVYPYWLIGEVASEPRGCVMAAPGKPFGRIEMLCVDQSLPKRERAVLVRDLGYAAIASCQSMGCSAILATVSDGSDNWRMVMQGRGWQEIDHGSFLLKRVA